MKAALFRSHQDDPLGFAIRAITRAEYVHVAILADEVSRTIYEAYYPHVRKRVLGSPEIAGIDFFDIKDLTPKQSAGVVAYCDSAVAAMEKYSIADLFRFLAPVRAVIGEATDTSVHSSVICSQFAFDAFDRGAGIKLLRAHSYQVDPGRFALSPLLIGPVAI